MDLTVHNQILWHACVEAMCRLKQRGELSLENDPTVYFPYLVGGSWITDMNQSTLFTDMIPKARNKDGNFDLDKNISNFFEFLWAEALLDLKGEMKAGPYFSEKALKHFNNASDSSFSLRVLGAYSRFDHFDVLEDDVSLEHCVRDDQDNLTEYQVSMTIEEAMKQLEKIYLLTSSLGKDMQTRTSWRRLIFLGKALHCAADFYAHSNYIELLLWSLAYKDDKSPSHSTDWGVLDNYNEKEMFLHDEGDDFLYCPFPRTLKEVEGLDKVGTILWYGPGPRHTPLTTCLFDTKDTAFSLLSMYASQLEIIDDDMIDLDRFDRALSVFIPPSAKYLRTLANLGAEASNTLTGYGLKVREFLAEELLSLANKHGGKNRMAQGLVGSLSTLIDDYRSGEAKDWAKAGRLNYVANIFQKDIAEKFFDQKTDRPQLPHHTLLCKDKMPDSSKDKLRFRLACVFAVEATTELLLMHFSKQVPDKKSFRGIRDRFFIHPSSQLSQEIIDSGILKTLIHESFIKDWSCLASKGLVKTTNGGA